MDPRGSGSAPKFHGSATLLLKLKSRDPASLRGLSASDANFCFVDQSEEIQEEWKPGFLSNEEFTQAGFEKNPLKKRRRKNPSKVGFLYFFWGSLVFFWFFGFFIYLPRRESI
jgi:hypothetical protein